MNIDRQFIENVVNSFYAALLKRDNLCQVAQSELTVEFYKKRVYQELYALRYLPAYYFEYCVLANELKCRLENGYKKLNIFSFGCGLSPDYYAFRDNLAENSFTYTGFDSVEWSSKKHMPFAGDNYTFVCENIANLNFEDIAKGNVFVFPKSIGDIKNNGEGILERLGGLISKSEKKEIYFLNSYITRGRNIPVDISAFKVIHNKLISAGFKTNDDIGKSFYKHDGVTQEKAIGLRAIHSNFVYPDDKRIECEKNENDNVCNDCPVPRSPILTNGYMAYQVMGYTKE